MSSAIALPCSFKMGSLTEPDAGWLVNSRESLALSPPPSKGWTYKHMHHYFTGVLGI